MSNDKPPASGADAAFDIAPLWPVVWRYRYLIIAITAISGAVAVVLALTAPLIYRAEVTVTEVHENTMGGGSSIAGQLGGLASLAGVNLQASNSNQNAAAVLQSRHLVEEFIKRNQLLPQLLPDSDKPPTLWSGVKKFRDDVVNIRDEKRTGTTVVAVDWTDPAVAARWANQFVSLANELLRTRARDEASRNIAYLKSQMEQTSAVEVQRAMYGLVESETKTLMLANGRIEYAFAVVDPAVAPEIRIRPKRTLMVLFGLALGFVLGTAVAFLVHRWKGQRHRGPAVP